ncbi:MAG: hypothetical protein LBS15_03065 [Endomicrobium sp.]|jgi:hypothetical protein|nr:hypothetical protein [Endomicrobium sp.]
MIKNIKIIVLFNIILVLLSLLFFVWTDSIFFLFLISPFISLVFLRNLKIKSLRNSVDLEKQGGVKQEIMDDIWRTVNYTKRRYKNDLINKNIMLVKGSERLKKRIDKSKISKNCKKELKDYLNKQISQGQ